MFEKIRQRRKGIAGYAGSLLTGLFVLALMLAFVLPINVCAGNVTNGTLGDNAGIEWTYDADTKILTVTGEDSGLSGSYSYSSYESPFVTISSDVEKIVMKDCTLHGSVCALFAGLRSLKEVEFNDFDTSSVTDMAGMFDGCTRLTSLDVSNFDTSNVTDMGCMFCYCANLTSLDVSNFDTSNVTDMGCMFCYCANLTSLDVSNFDTSNVTNMGLMFWNCSSLESIDLSSFDTSNVTDMGSMFYYCSNLTSLDVSGFDTSSVGSMADMFNGCSNLTSLDVSGFDTSSVTSMGRMFNGCSNLTSLDVSGFDTSNVTAMWLMFYGCSNLKNLDVSDFDTSNAIYMEDMFNGCTSLKSLDVSGFDTSSVTNMGGMFSGCSNLTSLDVSGFDTSSVAVMGSMFSGCSSLTSVDVSNFDTSSVGGMGNMFSGCSSLTSVDVSNFDTSDVAYMDHMFSGCINLKNVDVSSFDTSNAWSMHYMFSGCGSLTSLDLSSFDMSNVIRMWDVLSGCDSLEAIYTPKKMLEDQEIQLPYTFYDEGANSTTNITATFCNKKLTKAEPVAVDPVVEFVTRMYKQCLSRDPDQEGLDGWVGQLKNGQMNGAQIAEQFVFSAEMLAKNLSNEEFVNILYRAMMGREADAAGRTGWVNELNNGYLTRSEVTKCFVESTEFTNICSEYGITRGTYDASMAPIEHFVTRFYTLCLERNADQTGLYGWVNNLKNQYMNGAQIADAFIFSDEFVNKNVSDEKYVELLYNTLLGRPSDANGKAGWVGELQGGYMTREGMMKAFIESTEFTGICEKYGITRGTVE